MIRWKALAPVAVFAVTGCMASKADIVLLQDEIRTLRAMQARTDSTRRASADSAIMLSQRSNDSLRALAQRFGAFQSFVSGELFEIGRQLITVQERTGLSAKQLSDLRAAYDERVQSATADTSGPPSAPGPNQLFSTSFDQMRRGSFSTARVGFDELLKRYPNFDQASAAQLHIGSMYESEKKYAEADSVYLMVVARYPRSNDAPTALYKYGLLRQKQGKPAEAKEALQRVIREYPRSTEAELAASTLPTIK
jgi:tol-pal system protein YbgF